MARKSLGYVELEWTCPSCGTRNPGSQKTCLSCGMPQPDDVEFEQPAQEKLIEDEAKLAKAKAGPDIHCHYCGSPNPGTAKTCSQCGADLSEGTKRQSGQVLGAHRDKPAAPIKCPACGTSNDAAAPKCVRCGASLAVKPEPKPAKPTPPPLPAKKGRFGIFGVVAVVVVLLICAACVTFFVLSNRTSDVNGTVKTVSWSRTIAIEALVPVTREDWRDQIPPGAIVGVCTQKVHHTESRSTGRTREICGTPYTVNKGSGFGEVVQDCQTEDITEDVEVYADSCQYTIDVWQEVDKATAGGNDLNPRWPAPRLRGEQREGNRTDTYNITFTTEQGTYSYSPATAAEFARYNIGSRWILKINTFDTVTGVEPLK